MDILVFNCGSSSLKYRLLRMPDGRELAGGEAQRVGPPTAEPAQIVHRHEGRERILRVAMPDHQVAFTQAMALLTADVSVRPGAIGHRFVNGGAQLRKQAVVDQYVLTELERAAPLAPLHNPPALTALKACTAAFPDLPQVVVADTAFHAQAPEAAHTYPVPLPLARRLGLRKFGFHGISHQYVATEAARFLGLASAEFTGVTCHLGSGGASLCAIVNGISVDNTMGYTPLQGLVMSTRSGDLDPGVVLRLLTYAQGDSEAVHARLNERSGILGLSGASADIRDALRLLARAPERPYRAALARDVSLWRLRKYIGAYLALVGRAAALVFTDTLGETEPEVRARACAGLEPFGIDIDPARNAAPGALPIDIATAASPVRVLVIATNEELAIARSVCLALQN